MGFGTFDFIAGLSAVAVMAGGVWFFNDFFKKGTVPMARTGTIYPAVNGFALYDNRDTFVASYARRRDAVRGANRKGIVLA